MCFLSDLLWLFKYYVRVCTLSGVTIDTWKNGVRQYRLSNRKMFLRKFMHHPSLIDSFIKRLKKR